MRARVIAAVVSAVVVVMAPMVPASASFPGTNGKISFLVNGSRLYKAIFTMDPDGTAVVPLSPQDGYYTAPAWSPDGTQLAFVRYKKANAKLLIANADMSHLTTVLVAGRDLPSRWGFSHDLAWSPDGLHLVIELYSASTGNENLFVVGTDGSGLTRLSGSKRYDFSPAWSNDGSTIAFIGQDAQREWRLMLMDTDGTHRRVVRVGGAAIQPRNPDWAPDDSAIVFDRWDGTQIDLYTVLPGGGGLTQVTDTPTRWEAEPAFSPDGSLIVYARSNPGYRRIDLWSVTSDGGTFTRLTSSPTRWEEDPSWQPL